MLGMLDIIVQLKMGSISLTCSTFIGTLSWDLYGVILPDGTEVLESI